MTAAPRRGPDDAAVNGLPDRIAGTIVLRAEPRVQGIARGNDRHQFAQSLGAGAAMHGGHVDAGLVAGDPSHPVGGLLRTVDQAIAPHGEQRAIRGPGYGPDIAPLDGPLIRFPDATRCR